MTDKTAEEFAEEIDAHAIDEVNYNIYIAASIIQSAMDQAEQKGRREEIQIIERRLQEILDLPDRGD